MLGRTHFVIGALTGVALAPFLAPERPWLFAGLVAFASLWPDVDHEKSTINRLVPVTRVFPMFFRHRGFFHSIFPPLLLYLGLAWGGLPFYALAFFIGYLSHLISDCFTREGINFLHPLSQLRIQGPFTTGTILESLLFLVLSGALGILVFMRLGVLS